MPPTAAEILARCPLFAELDDGDLGALAAIAQRRSFEAGATLFLAHDLPEGMHVVVAGVVKVFVLSPETGREIVLTMEYPYATVAELASFDGGPYPAHAQATERTETLFLEAEAFERVLHERPIVTRYLLRRLGSRLRRLVGLIEQLSFQEVVHRLAGYLLERARDGAPFTLETNAAIAAQVGTVAELVSRNLARLHTSGAITLDGRSVSAFDRERLTEMAARGRR
jgi:CRP-like cAMP-binding protein